MKENEHKKNGHSGDPEAKDDLKDVKPGEYVRAAKTHLRNNKEKAAFSVLQQAIVHYPDDPFILSYYGCLQAIVDKRHRSGVENCRKALALLKNARLSSEEMLYPVFYLNLGRAYTAAGKKKDAVDAFEKGLKYDSRNSELLKEVRALGVRKKPPLSFLDRSNPINKYIGMILNKSRKEIAGKK